MIKPFVGPGPDEKSMDACDPSPPLTFGHDQFFGDLHLSHGIDGITLSHRTANAPPETVKLHTHVEAHFVLVTDGQYLSSATGAANAQSTLVYNPPGTTHRDRFANGSGAFFSISISNARFCASLGDFKPPHTALHLPGERSRGLTVALLMECGRWNAASPLRSEALCLELIAAASNARPLAGTSPPRWLVSAIEQIRDCPGETPGIRELASAVGVHPTHLARLFRRFLGCTPGDILRARRLELAAAQLRDSSTPLSEIGFGSGFSDQAQFTNAFRRVYGVPPGLYRRLSSKSFRRRRVLHFDKTT